KSTIIATILDPQAKLSNFQPELNPPQTNSQYNYHKYFRQLKNHKSNNQSPQPSTLENKSTIIATILDPQAKLSNFQPGSESSSAIPNFRINFKSI
ncbi:8020_t:CDS:2, partial [Entrophospora sp. SA101]